MYRAALSVGNVIYHQKCWAAGSSTGQGATNATAVETTVNTTPDMSLARPIDVATTVMSTGVEGVGVGAGREVLENKTEKEGSTEV